MCTDRRLICLAICLLGLGAPISVIAQKPATLAEAAAVMDLSKFPLPPDADTDADTEATRHLASVLYYTKAAPDAAFEYVKKQLGDAGWKELPGSYATNQFASGLFEKSGYHLSVSSSQNAESKSMVSITNQGNVNTKTLPLPPGFEQLFGGEFSSVFVTKTERDTAAAACTELLVKAGWQPFGTAGEQLFFKQNAVRLSVYITVAPAQQNKTSVTFGAELMSADLPPPPDAKRVEYAESTTTLSFDSSQSSEQLFAIYRDKLKQWGWSATTDNPIKDRLGEELTFRNPQQDMLTLEIQDMKDFRRGLLTHMSAAEVADLEKMLKDERAKSEQKKQ